MNISLVLPFPHVREGSAWRIGNRPYVEIPNVVLGTTVTEEFSETLDSASVVVAQVPESERLSDLVPYQECVLKAGSLSYPFLVDEFEETMESLDRDGNVFYSYQISLMSRTKYLEKIQLPNLCVTHGKERQTIAHYIGLWCGLYLPLVKIANYDGTGHYYFNRVPLLSLDPALTEKGGIFDVPCADLQLSKPTLRQALTALMAQVGCIPAVKGGEISFLNLREEQERSPLQDDPSVIVSRSCSSGSFVNRLVNPSGNLIDDSGISVSERLKFSDKDNLLLKNLENLKLETRFPIYKIQSLKMNAFFGGTTVNVYPIYSAVERDGFPSTTGHTGVHINIALVKDASGSLTAATLDFQNVGALGRIKVSGTLYKMRKTVGSFSYHWEAIDSKAVSAEKDIDSRYDVVQNDSYSYHSLMDSRNGIFPADFFANAGKTKGEIIVFAGKCSIKIHGDAAQWDYEDRPFLVSDAMEWSSDSGFLEFREEGGSLSVPTSIHTENSALFKSLSTSEGRVWYFEDDANDAAQLDITPITFDETIRQGLSMDFVELTEKGAPLPLSELAKYYYSTVGYQVGGNEISGFSQNYTETNGWWDVQKSVAEMLCSVAEGWASRYEGYGLDDASGMFGGVFDEYLGWIGERKFSYNEGSWNLTRPYLTGYSVNFSGDRSPVTPWGGGYTYATLFFDVVYRPIASPVLKFTGKVDAQPLPVEQMDSKQNGLSSVEAVSSSEYDTVERLTSDALAIYQRADDMSKISPLNAKYTYGGHDYTIFKRVLSFKAHCVEANYYASRDYVIKNFYTSIITKYRAYQYVDLSESTERHESVCDCLKLTSDGWLADTSRSEALLGGEKAYGALFDGICTLARPDRYFPWDGSRTLTIYYSSVPEGGVRDAIMSEARKRLSVVSALPKACGISASCRLWDGETSGNEEKWVQDESAVSHSDRFVAFTALDFDNASEGLYISAYYVKDGSGATSTQKLGGVPQNWYPAQSGGNPYGVAKLDGFEFASELQYYLSFAPFDEVMELPRMVGSPSECGAANEFRLKEGDRLFSYFEKDGSERFAVTMQAEIANEAGGFEYTEGMVSKSTLASASQRSAYYEYVDGKECVCVGVWKTNLYEGKPLPSWKSFVKSNATASSTYEYSYAEGEQYPYKGSLSVSTFVPGIGMEGPKADPGSGFLADLTHAGKISPSGAEKGDYAAVFVPVEEYSEAMEKLLQADAGEGASASFAAYLKPLMRIGGDVYLSMRDEKADVAYAREFGALSPAYEAVRSTEERPSSSEVVPLPSEE